MARPAVNECFVSEPEIVPAQAGLGYYAATAAAAGQRDTAWGEPMPDATVKPPASTIRDNEAMRTDDD